MSQVFLSYAREDQPQAETLAAILARRGWSVWWDREIVAGRSFEDDIDRELQAAAAVVVLWSRASVASSWVRNEAAEGMKRRVLVPARIDDAEVPLGFRGLQTADLSGWKGDEDGPALRPIVTAVAALLASQDSASGQGETRAGSRSTSSEAAGGTAAPPPQPDVPQQRRERPLEGLLVRTVVAFAAGLTYPSVPAAGGVVIAMAMVGVAALAVWARRHRPLSRAIAGTELELFALALLFAAGVTLERGASPWAEWPDLVRHFGGVLLRGWVGLALLAAVAQWMTSRYFSPDTPG